MGDEYVSVEALHDANTDSASGYVFQRVGEVCFAPAGACAPGAGKAGSCQVLAVAARHGITVYADDKGALALRPGARCRDRHLNRAPANGRRAHRPDKRAGHGGSKERGGQVRARAPTEARSAELWRAPMHRRARRELEPVGDGVCACTLPPAEAVALSPDARLLAVARGGAVHVHRLHALVAGQAPEPLATWRLPEGAALRQARPFAAPASASPSVNAASRSGRSPASPLGRGRSRSSPRVRH